MSTRSGDKDPERQEDAFPRRGLLANMPKHSLSRILILLAALLGILNLRARTGSIAGCMSDAFRAPPPSVEPSQAPIKLRVELPSSTTHEPKPKSEE